MGQESRLEIKILARDLAKEALEQAKTELQQIGQAARKAGEGAKAGGSGFGALNHAVKAFMASAVVQQVAQAAVELGKLGLQSQAVEEKFTAMAGGTAQARQYLEALTQATDGTVDKMTLMAAGTQMLSMGLANSAEQAAELATMAVRLGNAQESASERITKFDMLLANQSVEVLDSYGISSAKVRARILELQAATAGLSREEAFKIAVLEQGRTALERLGDAGTGATQATDRLSAAFTDAKVVVGQQLAPAFGGLLNVLTAATTTFSQLAQISAYARGEFGYFKGTLLAVGEVLGLSTELQDRAAETSRALAAGESAAAQAYNDVGVHAAEAVQPAHDLAAAQAEANEAAANAAIAFNNAAAGLQEMGRAQFVQAQLDGLKASLDNGTLSAQQYAMAQEALLTTFGILTPAEQSAQSTLSSLSAQYAAGKLDAESYAAGVQAVKASLDGLQDKTVTVKVNVEGEAGLVAPGKGEAPRHYAAGGAVRAESWAWVGERGPELVRLPQGAQVFTAQESRRMAANGGTTVYAPVTIQATLASGMDVQAVADQVSRIIGQRVAARRV